MAGRKPNPDRSQVRHRNPVSDWTEVDDVPFTRPPKLPDRDDPSYADGKPRELFGVSGSWPRSTQRWYEVISRMPHAKLWTKADWQYVFVVAECHARFAEGWKGHTGAELRMREKALGVTAEQRRDLRIRYVDPKPKATAAQAGVINLDDHRSL